MKFFHNACSKNVDNFKKNNDLHNSAASLGASEAPKIGKMLLRAECDRQDCLPARRWIKDQPANEPPNATAAAPDGSSSSPPAAPKNRSLDAQPAGP